MRHWKALIKLLAVAVAVALIVVACAPKAAPEVKEKSIKVGNQLSITAFGGSGYGMSMGALNYIQYVNDELGGIKYKDPVTGKMETVKIEVLWEDAGYNPARAISVYKKHQAAGVKAMIIMGSGTQDGLLEFAIRDHMPLWGNGSSTSALMVKTEPKWWTTSFYSLANGGGAAINYVKQVWKETRPAKIAFVNPDVPACRGFYTPTDIDEYAKSQGVEVVGKYWLPFALTDSTVELTKVKEMGADFVYSTNTTVGFMVVLLKDAVRLGMKDKTQFMTYQYAIDESLFKLAPEAVEGLIFDSYYALNTEDVPGVKLLNQISQKYQKQPLQMLYICGGVHGLGFVQTLKLALEKDGFDKFSGDTVRNAMYSIKDFDTGGLTQPITISQTQIAQCPFYKIGKVQGGTFKSLTGWTLAPSVMK